MAGINPNLGKINLQNVQLNATEKVDTQQSSGNEVGDAKKSAIWLEKNLREAKRGDIVIIDGNPYRIGGGMHFNMRKVEWSDVTWHDFEEHGDVTTNSTIYEYIKPDWA